MKLKSKILTCYIFGHKIAKYTDSGYLFCERCDKHEYYDDCEIYHTGIIKRIINLIKYPINNVNCWYKTHIKNELPF